MGRQCESCRSSGLSPQPFAPKALHKPLAPRDPAPKNVQITCQVGKTWQDFKKKIDQLSVPHVVVPYDIELYKVGRSNYFLNMYKYFRNYSYKYIIFLFYVLPAGRETGVVPRGTRL